MRGLQISDEIPIQDGRTPSEAQKQLIALFQELEKGQLDVLDGANKRIIELTTALLGLLFAVAAFGKDFPPPYLQPALPKVLAIAALVVYLLAMICAFIGLQPKEYDKYDHNLTEMREELRKIIQYKSRGFQAASGLFVLGCLLLVALLIAVILM
ncbi:MAG: hypothetical protein GWP61_19295 [Chloroflexi bacterium]|nr:hypothetical protein [Chloroflexota bacterium]